jgi:hypothetical protein
MASWAIKEYTKTDNRFVLDLTSIPVTFHRQQTPNMDAPKEDLMGPGDKMDVWVEFTDKIEWRPHGSPPEVVRELDLLWYAILPLIDCMPTAATWSRDSIDAIVREVHTLMGNDDNPDRVDETVSRLIAFFAKGNESTTDPTYQGSVLMVSQILALGITTAEKQKLLEMLFKLQKTNPGDPRIFATFERIGRLRRSPTFATISEAVQKLERQLVHRSIKDVDTRCRKRTNRTCEEDIHCDWHPPTPYTNSMCLSKTDQPTEERRLAPAIALLNTIQSLPVNNHYLWFSSRFGTPESILRIQQKRQPFASVRYISAHNPDIRKRSRMYWYTPDNQLEITDYLITNIISHVPMHETVMWNLSIESRTPVGDRAWGHSGVCVLSKRSPTHLVLSRFDSNGGDTRLYDATPLDAALALFCRDTLTKLLSVAVEYQPPSLTCPVRGPQSVQMRVARRTITLIGEDDDTTDDGVDRVEPFGHKGYCAAWAALLMHLQVAAPLASMADLYSLTTRDTPENTRTLILNYAGLLVEHSRDGPTFSTVKRWDGSLRSKTSGKRTFESGGAHMAPSQQHQPAKRVKVEPDTYVSDPIGASSSGTRNG